MPLIFICLFLVFTQATAASATTDIAVKNDAYTKASDMYLPTLVEQQKAELAADEKEKKELKNKSIKEQVKAMYKLPSLGKYETLQFMYNRFAAYAKAEMEKNKSKNTKELLGDNVFVDLDVFCGGKKQLNKTLATFADHTQTVFGKLVWQSFFTQNYENIEQYKKEIIRRQNIVKSLVENEKLFKQIDKSLKNIAKASENIAFFEKELDGIYLQMQNNLFYFGSHWYGDFTSWNEKNKILNFFFFDLIVGNYLGLTIGACAYIIFFGAMGGVLGNLGGELGIGLGALVGGGLGLAAYIAFIHFLTGDPSQNTIGLANAMHEKVNYVAATVQEMGNLAEIIEKQTNLKNLIPNYKNLIANASPKTAESEVVKLFAELKKNTFKGEPSFFSNKGRMFACFKKIGRLRGRLVPAFKTLGEVDAYMSIAKLYKKYANHPNAKFCFPEIVSAKSPYINIQGFWHPFLDPNTAVTNSIELGIAADNSILYNPSTGQNMLVTGPNGAGKTLALKGTITAIIFAEVLGIAPATKMTFTPFARINSHLNVSDDIGRESLYQAEKNRVVGFLNEAKKLGSGEFEFVIMDEMFSSTNPEEGQAAAYAIAKSLTRIPNCMCLLATHFKKLSELEKDTNGYFKNYKVYVEELPDGKLKCPYKIVPGISNQSIAILMLKQDFDDDIVNEAYDVLADIKDDTSDIIGFKESRES